MRPVLAFVLAVVGALLLEVGATEAACGAAGDYSVSGQIRDGIARLTETSSDEARSSGQAMITLFSRFTPPAAEFPVVQLSGRYEARLTGGGQCAIILSFGEPTPPGSVSAYGSQQVGGVLAFGGAVIIFQFYDDARLDLSIGIRSDFILRQ